jgi:hypothetical protein
MAHVRQSSRLRLASSLVSSAHAPRVERCEPCSQGPCTQSKRRARDFAVIGDVIGPFWSCSGPNGWSLGPSQIGSVQCLHDHARSFASFQCKVRIVDAVGFEPAGAMTDDALSLLNSAGACSLGNSSNDALDHPGARAHRPGGTPRALPGAVCLQALRRTHLANPRRTCAER